MFIQIFESTKEDIPELTDLLNDLFTLEKDFTPDSEKQIRGLKLIIDNPERGIILVAKNEEEEIIGMVNLQFLFSTCEGEEVVLLEDLVVKEEYRRLGIGSLIIKEVVTYCQANNYKRIQLLADKNNKPALDFYRKQGFTFTDLVALRTYIGFN